MKFVQILKKNKLKVFYLFILIIIFFVFIGVAYFNFILKKELPEGNYYAPPIIYTPESYPSLLNKEAPFISAQGAIVIDRDSLVVLYEKNPNLRFSPASTAGRTSTIFLTWRSFRARTASATAV